MKREITKRRKYIQFAGIAGTVLLAFGILTWALEGFHWPYVVPLHIGCGSVLLFFFAVSGGFRLLIETEVKRAAGFGTHLLGYSALFIGVIAVVNIIAERHQFLHFDATAEKVYSLAPQTISVIEQLQQPIVIRGFFVAGKIERREEELIERIVRRFPEKVSWQLVDPEKKPQLVEKFGIEEPGTLHLSFAGENSERAVKLSRDRSEQEFVNAIIRLSREGTKTAYYVKGHGEPDLRDPNPEGFKSLLGAIEGENIVVQPLELGATGRVPADANMLILAAPKRALLPSEFEAIAAYLAQGGSAVFLHEPKTSDDIRRLVRPFGVNVGKNVVVDQVVGLFAGPALGVQPVVSNYNVHEITQGFRESTVFTTVSSVTKSEGEICPSEDCKVIELAKTSKLSWAEQNVDLVFSDSPSATLEPEDARGPIPIAVAVERRIPSEGDSPVAANSARSERDSRLVVIGDRDFVANSAIAQLFNRDFFLNAVNWTIGESKAVTIRPRTLRQSKQLLTTEQFNTIFLVTAMLLPELFLLAGLSVWWLRRE